MIRFADPAMLAAAVPLALFVLWRVARLGPEHVGGSRRAAQIAMTLAALAAVVAVGRPEFGRSLDRMAVVFVVDDSRSVAERDAREPAGLREVRRAIAAMREDDRAGVVVFGADAATLVAPSPRPPIGIVRASIGRDATDIAAGLRRALGDLPASYAPRIVLVSDGVQTRGDALDVAQIAAGRGVAIDVLPIERAPSPEIAIERVRVPPVADPGQPIELRVVTRSNADAEVQVEVLRDGQAIARGRTRVRAGSDVLALREVAPPPGLHRYDVVLAPLDRSLDATPENNEGGALLRVTGGSRALVLSAAPEGSEALAQALRGAGIEVVLGDATQAPANLAEMAAWDLIVLSDLPARALTDTQIQELATYVRELGGGLWMLGARDAFGLGGYAQTDVEEVLPATFDLRRRRDRASLAMVIAIDKSGSMTVEVRPGVMKLDLANEAAARSAMLLSPFDRVAVAHVDTGVHWTQRMTTVDDPARIAAIVRRAQPGGGGIYVDVTLEASYGALRQQPSQLKHLLLFSDGSDSEEMIRARTLVSEAARNGITTSIVSMGNGPDTPELERLSALGGGRFYIVEDLTQLPRIFTEETVAASRAALANEPFRAVPVEPSVITRGLDFDRAPALGGYAIVNPRPSASVLLRAADEDPLLLVHQRGIGRGAVFATDAGSMFARPWLAWPGYAALVGQLGRSLVRTPERRDAQLAVTLGSEGGRVVLEAIGDDGRPRNYLDLSASIGGPHGAAQQVALRQTGAGRYEARFAADAPGAYLVTVREGTSLVASTGAVRTRGDELRGEGTDHAMLAQIASLTGGTVRRELGAVFRERPPPTFAYDEVWRPFVIATLLSLLLSVALRRLVWTRKASSSATASASAGTTRSRTTAGAAGPTTQEPTPAPLAAPIASAAASPPTTTPPTTAPPPSAPEASPPPAAQSTVDRLLARRKDRRR